MLGASVGKTMVLMFWGSSILSLSVNTSKNAQLKCSSAFPSTRSFTKTVANRVIPGLVLEHLVASESDGM
jgi:glycerol uptake facilitator-like aquaporin